MAFENLRDQLAEQWADLSSKIQEHPAFNSVREQFESQTPAAQRGIVAGAAVLVSLFLLSFPYGYWSSSATNMETFEENRRLIGELLSIGASKTPSPLPTPVDTGMIRNMVESRIRSARIIPDQIGEKQDIPQPAVPIPALVPSAVTQNGIAIQLKKLNVDQIVQVATELQNLGTGYKLMGLDVVQSASQTHYYDVIFKVVHFGLPEVASSAPEPAGANKGRRPPPNRPGRDEEGD